MLLSLQEQGKNESWNIFSSKSKQSIFWQIASFHIALKAELNWILCHIFHCLYTFYEHIDFPIQKFTQTIFLIYCTLGIEDKTIKIIQKRKKVMSQAIVQYPMECVDSYISYKSWIRVSLYSSSAFFPSDLGCFECWKKLMLTVLSLITVGSVSPASFWRITSHSDFFLSSSSIFTSFSLWCLKSHLKFPSEWLYYFFHLIQQTRI